MSLMTTVTQLKGLSSLVTLGIKQIFEKKDAEESYRAIVPLLKESIRAGKTINDPNILNAQEKLESLAPFGARRRNFKKWYIGSTAKLLTLPDDPDRLSIACWW